MPAAANLTAVPAISSTRPAPIHQTDPTFLAPPLRWAEALSMVVYTPVDSHTYSTPLLPQGISPASLQQGLAACREAVELQVVDTGCWDQSLGSSRGAATRADL